MPTGLPGKERALTLEFGTELPDDLEAWVEQGA